ncbi:interleukin-6 receptor subunit alpha [Pyxicephalus adspersus]
MVVSIQRRYSYFIIMYSGLLLTCANTRCSKPVLSENTRVVPLHSNVTLSCPGCDNQSRWSRHNRTMKLHNGPHLTSVSYEDEDNYTCHRNGAPICTVQLLVEDDIEKPVISCYIRHPTSNITCDWLTTRELRPHAKVKLIAWMLNGNHTENGCSYIPSARKFTCSTLYKEGDSGRHTLSLCVIGRTGSQMSNTLDSTAEKLVQPDPPINVTVTPLEGHPRKLWVSWLPPRTWLNSFYELVYEVQYRMEGSQVISNGTTHKKHFLISDALARRRHVIRVRAKEEFLLNWSTWSEGVVGTPWSAEDDNELPVTTDFNEFIVTTSEEEGRIPRFSAGGLCFFLYNSPYNLVFIIGRIPRFVWLVGGVGFVVVLLLLLLIMMRKGEVRLLKLKGGLLRALFQPAPGAPAVSQPPSGEPLLAAPQPEAVIVNVPQPTNED